MPQVLGTALAVFLLDIASKQAALYGLSPFQPLRVLPGFFNLSLVFNRGAAFGMFPGNAVLFMVLAACAVAGILAYAWRTKPRGLQAAALGCIAGGAAGNLLDRIRHGHVIDFLDFYWRTWHWPAFNVADAALCTGSGLLVLWALKAPKN